MMISQEDRKELNLLAKAKGYNCLLIFPPQRLAIMRQGTILSTHEDPRACEAAIAELEPFFYVPPKTNPVGWTVDPQLFPEPPKQCSNQGGQDCLCLTNGNDGITVWCVVNQCDYPAGCKGGCPGHLGWVKLFGDLTKQAVSRTQALWEVDPESECEHGLGYHGAAAMQARWDSGERQRLISIKNMTGTSTTSATRSGQETKILGELLGVEIRPIGGGFSVIDKNGTVLAYDIDRKELLEAFYG